MARVYANIQENMDQAFETTIQLIIYYILGIVGLLVGLNLCLFIVLSLISSVIEVSPTLIGNFCLIATLITIVTFLFGGLGYLLSRTPTGSEVAECNGCRRLATNTTDFKERQYINIVQELACCYQIPVPDLFIEEDNSVNAFAAGDNFDNAAVSVTRGALEHFTREELLAVLGHEFAHIYNGDMLLSYRILGVNNSFGATYALGRWICETFKNAPVTAVSQVTTQNSEQDNNNQNQRKNNVAVISLGIMLFGYGLIAIGLIGKQIAILISRAVSRQREYLADSTSASRIKNPEAMANALMKIQYLYDKGTESECSAYKASIEHFYFSSVTSWYDTHPPIVERIRKLKPSYSGIVPAFIKSQIDSGIRPGLVSDNSGNQYQNNQYQNNTPVPNFAMGFTGAITSSPAPVSTPVYQPPSPQKFDDILHEPETVQCALYALVMDSRENVQNIQWDILKKNQDEDSIALIEQLVPQISDLSNAEKMRMVEISMPAMRQMSREQYMEFRTNIEALTAADNAIDMFELVLRMIIIGRLDVSYGLRKREEKYTKPSQLGKEFQSSLSYIAWVGVDNDSDARNAFLHAINMIGCKMPMLEKSKCSLNDFASALRKMQSASTKVKILFFKTYLDCVNYDGKITAREKELIYAVGFSLNLRFSLNEKE